MTTLFTKKFVKKVAQIVMTPRFKTTSYISFLKNSHTRSFYMNYDNMTDGDWLRVKAYKNCNDNKLQ